ncbi:MAG: rhodanese-like domain-containing protein [Desulfovibrionaceae bacterium]
MISKTIRQAATILALSAVLGLGFNALRTDGIPIVRAEQSSVQLDDTNGVVSLKDAAMLFLTKRAVFLDARSQAEYDMGHIQGALLAPVDEFEYFYPELKPKLEGREAIITYCDGERCPLGHELAEKLRAKGFDHVYVLVNGWTLWKNENLPVELGESEDIFTSQDEAMCTECGN